MELSSRLRKFYDEKRLFSITKRAKLSEMASYDAVSADLIPEDPGAKRKFATEQLSIATSAMSAFESIALECAEIQDIILEVARYSSYLDQIVPFKLARDDEKVMAARETLCALRTLFVESLVNDDMVSSRTVAAAAGVFTEIQNFDQFLRYFGEYISSLNIQEGPLDEQTLEDYKGSFNETSPGALLALVIGSDEEGVFEQQVKILNDLKDQAINYARVETESNVLCWSMSRSYVDLPVRLLAKAGDSPTDALERITRQITAVSELNFDEDGIPGLTCLAEWAVIIRNGMVTLLSLTKIFVSLLDATMKCIWEFLFFQLSKLEELEEFEVLESVVVMCQQTLFKEPVQ